MDKGTSPQLYLSIHYLRAIAALMVVAVHCFTYGLVPIDDVSRATWLKHGVALFFVISGFVMVVSTQGRDTGPKDFLVRRLIRIVPLYWVMTLAWSVVARDWTGSQMAASLLFVPSFDSTSGELVPPVLEPGWTLNFEMFFYLVFAAALLLPERARVWAVGIFLAAFTQLAPLLHLPPTLAYYADPLLLLFVGGMAIARYDLRLPALFVPAGFAALALLSDHPNNWIAVYLPALAIVLGARSLDLRLPHWRLPQLLGDASYSIYLSHLLVLQLALQFVAPHVPGPVTLLTVLVGASALGVLTYRSVEMPTLAWCREWIRRTRDRKARVQAA